MVPASSSSVREVGRLGLWITSVQWQYLRKKKSLGCIRRRPVYVDEMFSSSVGGLDCKAVGEVGCARESTVRLDLIKGQPLCPLLDIGPECRLLAKLGAEGSQLYDWI